MLHQKRSGKLARLKYLVAVPIGAALLCTSTLGFSKTYGWIDLAPNNSQNIQATKQQNEQPTVADIKLKSPKPVSSAQKKPIKVNDVKPKSPKPKIDQVKFPPPIIAPDVPADFKPEKSYVNEKGYKIEEGPFTANGKNYYVAIISEDATGKKIGSYYKGFNAYRLNSTLKSKYGYEFPDVKVSSFIPPPEPRKPKVDQIKFPPPVIKPDKSAPKRRVNQVKYPTIDVVKFPPPIVKPNPFNGEFLKFIADNVRYPAEAREKDIQGYVNVEVKIDDYMITNSRVIKGIGHGCDEEVLRVLNLYKNKTQAKSGTYLLYVAFTLADPNKENAYPPLPKIDGINAARVVITAYSIKK